MHPMRRPAPASGDGHARPAVRVPHTMLRVRHVLPTTTERRAVRHPSGTDILPTGLRKGNVFDATRRR